MTNNENIFKNLIDKTFSNKFDESNFNLFIKNFLNDIDTKVTTTYKGNDIPGEYKNHVNYFKCIGEFIDPEGKDLDILIVNLKKETGLYRARTKQRNFVANYLKRNQKDAALVVYYAEELDDWRFSYVRMEFKTQQTISGKVKIIEDLTPVRRYSFLVGKNEPNHTAKKSLLPILLDIQDKPTLTEIENSFSIEKVTKEFYIEISRKFTELVGGNRKIGSKEIHENGLLKLPSTHDDIIYKEFTVRLIGRLLFCWFLKKKSSDNGMSLIPDEILNSKIVENKPNFYHEVLEPLFFEVLNTPVKERRPEFKNSLWKFVPFLNGGLFSPHSNDYYKYSEIINQSQNINTLRVPDNWLKEVFEIFELYNFTIDESTSIDVDLSIDPEMLGRIFENLLAEINPITGETVRKSSGSYYTPRLIVEFMVDECLKQYLKTKTKISDESLSILLSYSYNQVDLNEKEKELIVDALDQIKIIDHACGSGAFPMGMLHKILLILQKIDANSKKWLTKKLNRIDGHFLKTKIKEELEDKNWDYIHKLGVIQDSIYGVDIQPIAVEISKLRVFLSLIVDEKINDKAPNNRGIEPLPNLEFKFVCANSLVGLPKYDYDHVNSLLFGGIDEDIQKLKELRNEYFSCFGTKKKKIETEFKNAQVLLFDKVIKLPGIKLDGQAMQLSEWNPFSDEQAKWFDMQWMFGVSDGFDIVIANPPYLKERDNKEIFEKINNSDFGIKYHQGKMDYWYYFLHKAIDIVKKDGFISFITSRYWLNSYGAQKLINRVKTHLTFISVLDIGKLKVFDNVAGYHMVSTFQKIKKNDYLIYKKIESCLDDISLNFETENLKISKILSNNVFTESNEITFESESHNYSNIINLGDITEICQGTVEAPDKIGKKLHELLKNPDIPIGAGVFVISKDEYNDLNLTKEEKSIIPQEVNSLVKERESLRKQKKWAESDILRERIKELGFQVRDTPQGPDITKT